MGRKALLVAMAVLGLGVSLAQAEDPVPPIGSSSATAVRQADGGIVAIDGGDGCVLLVAGCTPAFTVSRRTADGALDLSFGSAGHTVAPAGDGTARSVAIDPKGRIVLAGATQISAPPQLTGLLLARYLPNGTIDASFGSGGVATISAPGASLEAQGVVVAGNGTILVSTPYRTGSGTDLAVARLEEDGSLDTSFGGGGIARVSSALLNPESVGPIAVQADGRVLVGTTARMAFSRFLAVARFEPNGSLDPDFGSGGVFSDQPSGDSWGSLALQAVFADATGRVFLAGTERLGEHSFFDTVALRLDAAGRIDPGFGESGTGVSDLPNTSLLSAIPLADGSVFLAGTRDRGVVIARLGGDGHLVPTFNAGGKGVVSVAGLLTLPAIAFAEPEGGALVLAQVQAAHCREQGRPGWHRCRSEATIAYGPNGFLRRSFGGVGFLTRPPIHYCPQLPGTACGIDMSKRQLEGVVGRGSPRKAHLKDGRFLLRVRCDRRVETRCRIATGVQLEPGRFTSAIVSVKAGRSRLLRLPTPPSLARRLAISGSELRLRLRQRLAANGVVVAYTAGIRLLRR